VLVDEVVEEVPILRHETPIPGIRIVGTKDGGNVRVAVEYRPGTPHDPGRDHDVGIDEEEDVALGVPGAVLLVRDDDRSVVLTSGVSDLEAGTAMSADATFRIASLTKPYTASVVLQLDKSLDECGQVCGASWWYRMRTITVPLLRPGLLAAWLLIFVASVRELGASILLMGPDSKVMTPAIVEAWFSSSTEVTGATSHQSDLVEGFAEGRLFESTAWAKHRRLTSFFTCYIPIGAPPPLIGMIGAPSVRDSTGPKITCSSPLSPDLT
jgi:hypothetical protein